MKPADHPIVTLFDLTNTTDYLVWRDNKLKGYPRHTSELMVDIVDPAMLTPSEKSSLLRVLRKTNVALYRVTGKATTKHAIRQLGVQLGLQRLDGNLCADEDVMVHPARAAGRPTRGDDIIVADNEIYWQAAEGPEHTPVDLGELLHDPVEARIQAAPQEELPAEGE